MSLLRLNNVSLRYENAQVLRDVFFKVDAGERVGLIGKNGSGKTTLLRLLLGQIEPTAGRVERELNVALGYFSQFSELDGALSIQQVLEELFAEVRAWEQELEQISAALEDSGADLEPLLERQAVLIDQMNHRDGWDYGRQIDVALTKLGFSELRRAQPIDELSGGWRNRAALAQCLLQMPDVLLLDEPTNFLDVEGVAWLESWLTQFQGGAIVVSHDRRLLDRVVNRVVEVENYQLHDYAGNYSAYVRAKPSRIKMLERQFQHEEELVGAGGRGHPRCRGRPARPQPGAAAQAGRHQEAPRAAPGRADRHRPLPRAARAREALPRGEPGQSLWRAATI